MNPSRSLSVVVVEDYGILREELVHFLALSGFSAVGVNCGLGLDDWLASQPRPPDIAVLDLNLPGEGGLAIARRLRAAYPEMGIVMLTARKAPADRIMGYSSGADIYLTKPVSGDELQAVLISLHRRLKPQPSSAWQLGLARATITSPQGLSAELSANECAVLACLARAPDQIADTPELLLLCGNERDELNQGYVGVLLSRLRRKLAALAPSNTDRVIRAVRQKGYQLLISIEVR
jgi:DNA-binding response OmpR family regulator